MERDHHQHLESGPGQTTGFAERGSQLGVEIRRGSKNPAIGLLDQHDAAIRAVRLKRAEDVVGVDVGGNHLRQQPPRRRLWTGENKRFHQTKETGGDVGTIHAVRMPESPLINPVRT
jgi:hypothetical protein